MKGLVIRQPWIGMILRGEKTWEMRSQPCRHRGPIALIEKGSGTVVAVAQLVDDLAPLSEAELRSSISKHGIRMADIPDAVRNGWVRPWVLADVVRLSRPVRYNHTSGGSWVNLTNAEAGAVHAAADPAVASGRKRAPSSAASTDYRPQDRPRPLPLALSSMSGGERAAHMHKLPHIGGRSARSITDADVAATVSRRGDKLVINVSWDEDDRGLRRAGSLPAWREVVGVLAALVAMICFLGFIIHFTLGVISGSISALSAFKWIIPMFVSVLIASLLGQGHLFEDLSAKR